MVLNSLFNIRTKTKLHEIYDSEPIIIELKREHDGVEFVSTIDTEVFKIAVCVWDHIPNIKYTSIEFSKQQDNGKFTMDLQKNSKLSTVTKLIAAIKRCYELSELYSPLIIGVINDNHNKREKLYKLLLTKFGAIRVGVYNPPHGDDSIIVYWVMDSTLTDAKINTILQNIKIK